MNGHTKDVNQSYYYYRLGGEEFGIKYFPKIPPSESDSTSEKLAVMVIIGGGWGKSRELDLSRVSLKARRKLESLIVLTSTALTVTSTGTLRSGGEPKLTCPQSSKLLDLCCCNCRLLPPALADSIWTNSTSGEGSETHNNGTFNGGVGRNWLAVWPAPVVCNALKRAKLELMMLSGGGLVLAGDGSGELEADERVDGGGESDSIRIWMAEGTTIEMLGRCSGLSGLSPTVSIWIDGQMDDGSHPL